MLKLGESQNLNSIFQLNYTRHEKNVMIKNCLLQEYLQIQIATFFYKMYAFLFILKKYYSKSKIKFFNHNI